MNGFDNLELLKYFNAYNEYEQKKIQSRKRFEKDLFISITIIAGCLLVITASCVKMENYMKEIVSLLMEIAYAP